MGLHYHGCPECYEKWECQLDCTIEYDLTDLMSDGHKYGSYCTCPSCDTNILTKEFWAKYNGFTK